MLGSDLPGGHGVGPKDWHLAWGLRVWARGSRSCQRQILCGRKGLPASGKIAAFAQRPGEKISPGGTQ